MSLPFEPKLFAELVSADTQEIVERLGEPAIVRDLVAQIKGDRFLLLSRVRFGGECFVEQAASAAAQPEVLGQLMDECFFARGGGLVLFPKGGEKIVKVFLIFVREDAELTAKTVFEVVA